MLESFIAPEKKEIQQEVDYDSLVKDLYTAETRETFEKKRDEIIMKYKNDRVFDQSDLLIAWIEEGAVDNKNKILENNYCITEYLLHLKKYHHEKKIFYFYVS